MSITMEYNGKSDEFNELMDKYHQLCEDFEKYNKQKEIEESKKKESIKIGGVPYKLKFKDNYTRDFDMLGSHCGNSLEIIIDNGLKVERKNKTIIHELMEAINYEYEIGLEHNKITILESALYALIMDNKHLFDNIMKEGNIDEKDI